MSHAGVALLCREREPNALRWLSSRSRWLLNRSTTHVAKPSCTRLNNLPPHRLAQSTQACTKISAVRQAGHFAGRPSMIRSRAPVRYPSNSSTDDETVVEDIA